MKKYLFVCGANARRSPTAEKICREIAKQNKIEIEVSSAGISLASYFLGKRLTKKAADMVDKIFVMENYMKEILIKKYSQPPEKIFNLGIKDNYSRNDPELENILRRDLKFYLCF